MGAPSKGTRKKDIKRIKKTGTEEKEKKEVWKETSLRGEELGRNNGCVLSLLTDGQIEKGEIEKA